MRYLFFTYGTLQLGNPLSYHLRNATYLGKATTTEPFLFKDGGKFPFMVIPPKGSKLSTLPKVSGELYEVNEKVIHELDYLEGHPDFYTRLPIMVDTEYHLAREVIAYVITDKSAMYKDILKYKDIPSGVWNKANKEMFVNERG